MADSDSTASPQLAHELVDVVEGKIVDRAAYFHKHGRRIHDRYLEEGLAKDLETAIMCGRRAVDLAGETHPYRVSFMNSLGCFLVNGYASGKEAYLEDAIQVTQRVLDLTPVDHPSRAAYLHNHASNLYKRYHKTNEMADLDASIQHLKDSINTTPADSPFLADKWDALARQLGHRYSRIGAPSDLNESIRLSLNALNSTPKGHPDRPDKLIRVADLLVSRYEKLELNSDLDRAMQATREAMELDPDNVKIQAICLVNLGVQYGHKYSRNLGSLADNEEAIKVTRQAIDLASKDHQPILLNNLSIYLKNRYLVTESLDDINESISCGRKAVDADPSNGYYFNTLAACLSERYMELIEISDLTEAIHYARKSVEISDKADRGDKSNTLAYLLGLRFQAEKSMEVLKEAMSIYLSTLLLDESLPMTRINAAREHIRHSISISAWELAYQTAVIAMRLLSNLGLRSLDNADKQHVLSQAYGLASEAAAAALYAGKEPSVALTFLEQGRGCLATSLEEMRGGVLDLEEWYPELAKDYFRLVGELEQTTSADTAERSLESSWQHPAQRRYEAGKELDDVIAQIHQKPEFRGFFDPPSERQMLHAAQHGPIVVINVSKHRCDALLIEGHQIRALPLPDLITDDVEEMAKMSLEHVESPPVLGWLWDVIANPVLNALELTRPPSDGHWRRLWWVPTGLLIKLPLHAAGHHSKGSFETVLDRVMSSYASSVNSILIGRRRGFDIFPKAQMLIVGIPDTPGYGKLPYVTKEVAMLHDLCDTMAFDPVQPKHHEAIISSLQECKIFHFAGHGVTDTHDPSKSHLLLRDSDSNPPRAIPLTVATLLQMNLSKSAPFLAYLSACGTGRVKEQRFADESLHLISAFQIAGFRHVIGTLWEVNDEICVEMAKMTYEGIRDTGRAVDMITDYSVCWALHSATRELRTRWLLSLETAKSKSREAAPSKDCNTATIREEDEDRPRDAIPTGRKRTNPMRWVPYIHVGV